MGVDLSEEMLKVAGRKAAAAGVAVHRLKANLVNLAGLQDQSFDYAACLFSTLGLIVGVEARQRFLTHVFRLLRPGGVFVVHVHNRWFNVWTAPGRRLLFGELLRGAGGDLEEAASRELDGHGAHPFMISEARWMPARMR